jgi:ATP/maltotriose-dependent transcriptional regulator MalT
MISTQIRFQPFVGRDSELAFLSDHLSKAAAGQGSVILVLGPAGIGKTRLVREFQKTVGDAGRFAFGACLDYARGALAPFFQLLSSPSSANDDPEANPQDSSLEPSRTPRVFDSLLNRLAAHSQVTVPFIAVIEDLHWADDATLCMLEYLIERIHGLPICILVTCRNEATRDNHRVACTLSNLMRGGAEALYLEALNGGDVRFLTRVALRNIDGFPTELRSRIEDLAEGNPLYLEELLREAYDRIATDRPYREHIPHSLEATTLERFDRLPDSVAEILANAAVLGDEFDTELLSAVCRHNRAYTIGALQAAVDANFILEVDANQYRFPHALIRETIYSRLTRASALAVHARAAEELEALCNASERLAERAYHWSAASNASMALRYNEAAGNEAMALGTYRDAARFFKRALDFSGSDTLLRASLNEKIAKALYGDGAMDEAKEYFKCSIEGFVSLEMLRAAAPLIELVYNVYHYDGDIEGGLALNTRVLELVNSVKEQAVAEELLIGMASFLSNQGMIAEFDVILRRVATTKRSLSPRFQIQLHQLRAVAQTREGRVHAAVFELKAALELARATQSYSLIAEILCNLGGCYEVIGDLVNAECVMLEALDLSEVRVMARIERCHYATCLAEVLYSRGKLLDAERVTQRAVAMGVECEAAMVGFASMGIRIALATGQERLLARYADESTIALAFTSRKSFDIAHIADAFAKLYMHRGQPREAAALLKKAVSSVNASQFALDMLLTVAKFGDAEDLPTARKLLFDICARRPEALGKTYTAHFEAIVARCDLNWSARRRFAAISAAGFKDLGIPMLYGEALELAGRQKEALSVYKQMGAEGEVHRLERLFSDRGHRGGVLTRRQLQIGKLIVAVGSNREVAQRLEISEKTLENHITSIYRRLGVASRDALVAYFAGQAGSGVETI